MSSSILIELQGEAAYWSQLAESKVLAPGAKAVAR